MKSILSFSFLALIAFSSCSKDNAYTLSQNGQPCDTTNVSYVQTIVPIMVANCNGCHSGSSAQANLHTDSHQGLSGISTQALLGSIQHVGGYKPMPDGAPKMSDCDINKIKAWINQGKPNN